VRASFTLEPVGSWGSREYNLKDFRNASGDVAAMTQPKHSGTTELLLAFAGRASCRRSMAARLHERQHVKYRTTSSSTTSLFDTIDFQGMERGTYKRP